MKILIVDDSKMFRLALKQNISPLVDTIIEAQDGEECLKQIIEEKPNIAIIDLNMPKIGGIEVLEKIKNYTNNPQIVIYTADSQQSIKDECLRKGAKYVFYKPSFMKEGNGDFDLLKSLINQEGKYDNV
ncbi:MAG: response regulator [Halobacteriovoraceae bacterium]|nr:response regulator [Halobacteriovoraceae bacterium]